MANVAQTKRFANKVLRTIRDLEEEEGVTPSPNTQAVLALTSVLEESGLVRFQFQELQILTREGDGEMVGLDLNLRTGQKMRVLVQDVEIGESKLDGPGRPGRPRTLVRDEEEEDEEDTYDEDDDEDSDDPWE